MLSLCTGERLRKNVLEETNAVIQSYNNVLDTLMQQFRDRAVRGIIIDVRDLGKR
jgi:hypothetical protein